MKKRDYVYQGKPFPQKDYHTTGPIAGLLKTHPQPCITSISETNESKPTNSAWYRVRTFLAQLFARNTR